MASIPSSLSIPVDRISFIAKVSPVNPKLTPWTHITDRTDLCVLFEQESGVNQSGQVDQQTLLKIKEGIRLVHTLVLEDLVCQAEVETRRLARASQSPSTFAIFISSPNIAFRYETLEGSLCKIQLQFRTAAGFERASNILREFDLPLAPPPRRGTATVRDSPSISSYNSQGVPSVIPRSVANSGTVATSRSWHHPSGLEDPFHSIPTFQPGSSLTGINAPNLFPSKSAGIAFQPGPSLIESCRSVPENSRQEFHNRELSLRYQQQSSKSHNHVSHEPLRKSLFDRRLDTALIRSRALHFTQSDDFVSPTRCPGVSDSAEPQLPSTRDHALPSISLVKHDKSMSTELDSGKSGNETSAELKKRATDIDPREPKKAKTDAAVLTADTPKSSQVKKEIQATLLAKRKPTIRKRIPKKVFKSTATQTESSNISKSTQASIAAIQISTGIQADLVPLGSTTHQLEAELNSLRLAILPSAIAKKIAPLYVDTLPQEPDPNAMDEVNPNDTFPTQMKKRALRINKFGQQRNRIAPVSGRGGLSKSVKTHSPLDEMKPAQDQGPFMSGAKGVNKFGKRNGRLHMLQAA